MIEPTMKTTSVLLVDDDHDDFLLTRDILSRVGTTAYRVTWVEDYERAIVALRDQTYDVVLVDYRIGIRTGLEFIRESVQTYPDCPMILLTGLGDAAVDIAAQKVGAADYVVKGNLTEDLLDRSIRYACQQAKRRTLLNALLTNATAGMIAIDDSGKPLIWNVAGLVALDLDGTSEPACAIAGAIARASPDGQLCAECANLQGSVFELRASALPGGGQLIVFHDVTQRKMAEGLLRRAAVDAQAASDAKSSFLANFSHELRTPLAGILGMVRVLESSGVSDVQRDYLDTVKNCGLNLLGIINDILDLSKIESGHMTVEQIDYDPAIVVDDLVRLLAPDAFDKGVELAAFVDPAIPPAIVGDPHRLRQVLTNLVGNAIKFTSAGSVIVRAVVDASAVPPMLRFDVVDCGIGIPKERAHDLFQRFTQVDASTTRKYGGTGLGLALSRQLVELMGGQIWFESEPGEGSTFSFSVPFVVARGMGLAPRSDRYSSLEIDVLCISPSEGVGDVLRRYVEALGSTVTLARDLATADLASRMYTFGLIVIDATMPAIDIHEIKKSIGLNSRSDMPPIVYLEKYGLGRREGEANIQRPLVRATIDHICRLLANGGKRALPAAAPAIAARATQLKILVAEDNPVNQKLLTTLLHGFGHVSEIAGDGRQVIAACAKSKFDVILMDLNMPVMDGIEATKRLRAADETRAIPIIGLSATNKQIEIQRCLNAGMDDMLTKPIDWDRLVAVLDGLKSKIPPPQKLAS